METRQQRLIREALAKADKQRTGDNVGDGSKPEEASLRDQSLRHTVSGYVPKTLTPYEWEDYYREHGVPESHKQGAAPRTSRASEKQGEFGPDVAQSATQFDKDSRFVIVCPARSGSTMLVHLLRSHPNIWCNGEVFLRRGRIGALQGRYRQQLQDDPVFRRQLQKERRRDPARFVYRYALDPQGRDVVGFKFKLDEMAVRAFRPITQTLLGDTDLKVIFLTRENLFERYLSWRVANKVTRRMLLKDGDEEVTIRPVRLSPRAVARDLRKIQRRQSDFRQQFNQHRVLDITYEQLLQQPEATHAALCRFLAVPEHALTTPTRKIIHRSTPESVSNYDELADYFASSEFAGYFQR